MDNIEELDQSFKRWKEERRVQLGVVGVIREEMYYRITTHSQQPYSSMSASQLKEYTDVILNCEEIATHIHRSI